MNLILLTLAAVCYVVGGTAMKWADGFRHLLPTLGVFAAFMLGSALQTYAMRLESLGVGYVLVLGLEAVLAVGAGVVFFQETVPLRNGIGILLVLGGLVLLKLP